MSNAATKIAPLIHSKMVAILRDMDAIGKNKKNEQQGFKYRGIDDVYNTINPILCQHGVYMTAQLVSKTREERTNSKGTVLAFTCLHMRYRFTAEDGSFVETESEGEGMDSGDKSSNKAMAVAHKYALLQAFCVPTEDMADPDGEVHEVAPSPKPQPARQNEAEAAKKAATWANEAISLVGTLDGAALQKWASTNHKTIVRVGELAPALHKKLVDAMQARDAITNPLAA